MSIAFDETSTAFEAAVAALGAVVDAGVPLIGSLEQLQTVVGAAERARRLAAVALVDVIEAVDRSGLHRDQGHVSARVFVAHLEGLSGSESFRLDRVRRMVHHLDVELVAKAWRSGEVGVEQAVVLAKVFANGRVRDRFVADQSWFVAQAQRLSFKKFEQRVARWVQLVDEDGPEPKPDPCHERRDARLTQDFFSQAHHFGAVLGSLEGSRFAEVFTAYVDAEFAKDWAEATERLGAGNFGVDDLRRTAGQRRADALCQMAQDAANNPNPSVRVKRVHNIVWTGETAETVFARWFGVDRDLDVVDYRIADLNGNGIHADHAMVDLLANPASVFRRVIQDHAGVVVDLSSGGRFYTGLVRLGVELQADECFWPGCHRPTTACHIDHTRPAARGGPTNQSNGAPACPRHNLVKEAGYTVTRAPNGTISITDPNGQPIIANRHQTTAPCAAPPLPAAGSGQGAPGTGVCSLPSSRCPRTRP